MFQICDNKKINVADPDPGSSLQCFYDPWIQDPNPGWEKPDPG
jgi:hypothetical protein